MFYLDDPNQAGIESSLNCTGRARTAHKEVGTSGMKTLAILLFALYGAAAQPDVAQQLTNRALDAYEHGNYTEAERLGRIAIPKWEALGADYTPHLGITRMNLGLALSAQGRRPEALAELHAAVALLRGSFGARDLRTLTAMNLLAGTELMLGDYRGASLLLEEALPIERELYPADLQLSRTLGGLACLRMREHRPDDALPLAEESLKLALQSAGENSMDAALAYSTVAEVHRDSHRYDRALPLYRHALALYQKTLGPQHPRVASILGQEALVLIADGKLALAERQLKQALAILDASCPRCDIERWGIESNLAIVRSRQGKYSEADRLFSHVLALEESADPRPLDDMADTLNALAFVRRKEHRVQEAESLTRRAATLTFR